MSGDVSDRKRLVSITKGNLGDNQAYGIYIGRIGIDGTL
jgi:hypothetical protein